MKNIRAVGRLLGIVAVGLGMALLQGLFVGPILRNRTKVAQWIHKGVLRHMNIDIVVKGKADRKQQVMVASNHLSYLDASVLGNVFQGAFMGKREIASWPVLGFLVKQFDPILIERAKKKDGEQAYRDAQAHSHYKVTKALNEGKSIIFFPESTTSDGSSVQPYRAGMFRSLFNGAVDRDGKALEVKRNVGVQPVAIRVLEVNGQDATGSQELRDIFAWHGDKQGMLSHVWNNALMANHMKIEVTILPALNPKDFASPEDLANAAHKMVSDVVASKPAARSALRRV